MPSLTLKPVASTIAAPAPVPSLANTIAPKPLRRRRWQRFQRNRLSMLGAALIVALALLAIIGPVFAPYPRDATGAVHVAERLKPPAAAHWFGTDEVGRDILTRLLFGARVSLGAGLLVLISATLLGSGLGLVSAYAGGAVDLLLQRVTDIFLTTPGLILAMAVSAALGPSLINVMLATSLVWWPGYCRLTRSEVLRVKSEPYLEAARATGVGGLRMVLRHILPNIFTPVLIKASMDMGFAVLTLASLGFIGLGAQPPLPDWGKMVADGRRYLPESWWVSGVPAAAIFITVFGFNMLGDGLRDVFDPRAAETSSR